MNYRIVHYPTLGSTNDEAKKLADSGVAEGTVLWADFQTKGRGRFDRQWVSPRSQNLLFSVITRPRHIQINHIPIVTHVAAKSVVRALTDEYQLKCQIKRPNDVMVDAKKICGILVEGASKKQVTDYLVVGIGVNVNSRERDLTEGATSVYAICQKKQDRRQLLDAILKEFSHQYQTTFGSQN
ncbi:MAG: biotin--[acetyl-CoA-carboxylase] ligase [Candidatus Omnitrophica bacterium CG11_big_fil_rev_8_21_14_0_20_45_26]|uniref:Biotin--[acetyl-CoA-carboxylase] ligase n=1 Tax=Candidatus Abzuiibacterium crystallinum TaxID=1974748 RepID=A0A2H0LPJ1_9BACT|nr:MAG: biotin--[acetyl-CoA-carboxylase] ligase [Candidatus Omnitrophica bacterium CG11_big_fil_rev_8_21_14_0_20_45_26]PIW63539.1 MAG: biotin--[acetyl-CoA-carboxylase] ligase [Candidatus Omnitrophica bacterium CG12_big_fil_rev_8_21_14_0_65_45_16]